MLSLYPNSGFVIASSDPNMGLARNEGSMGGETHGK